MAKKAPKRGIPANKARPEPMAQLEEIARNLWWSWNPKARDLFEHANAKAFLRSDRNPVVALRKLSTASARKLSADPQFVRRVDEVHRELTVYLKRKSWWQREHAGEVKGVTAYFCMEYAVHESLPLYAGGLGVLAGDHLKSASDLGLPFVAIGIFWKKGYTRQSINKAGQQEDAFPTLKLEDTPLVEESAKDGRPLRLVIPMGDDHVTAAVRRLDVGRVPLYLLDTDLRENKPRDRGLTHVLYSGDRDTRIRQEILLGIGGWYLLRELGVRVSACHLNEGHAAFLNLERIAELMSKKRMSFQDARRHVTDSSVFTTHTPVPAGNEEFDPKLVDKYFSGYIERLGLDREQFHDLARVKPGNKKENFGMTPLALRTSAYANGVAALHGRIARGMWKAVFPGKKVSEVPIGHVTNGIHLKTWLHPRMDALFEDVFGADWALRQDDPGMWAACKDIPADTLWKLHSHFKQELVAFCRSRLKEQFRRSGQPMSQIEDILDPEALTIGFARRFAPYKRAALVFSDPKRFAKLLNDRKRPIQIIFAGKAHPADVPGKAIIERLIGFSRQDRFRKRVVFIEDYEMEVARRLVAGVDVWLNNPERPREASGTSGMKPALHGGLNLSILDGWWPEGYDRRNGWAIGKGKDHDGTKAADRRDVDDLYRLLEDQVVPLYYNRDKSGLPGKWIERMKDALTSIPPVFNTHRQVKEYLDKYYLPAMRKA